MKLSILIPAYNEEESITETIDQIEEAFSKVNIDHEIYVVNDNSKDNTLQVLEQLAQKVDFDDSILALAEEINTGWWQANKVRFIGKKS